MRIKKSTSIFYLFMLSTFLLLAANEMFVYVFFEQDLKETSAHAARIVSVRTQISGLSDRYVRHVLSDAERMRSGYMEEARLMNSEFLTLAKSLLPRPNNVLTIASLNMFESKFLHLSYEQEGILRRIEQAGNSKLEPETISRILEIERGKRAALEDILAYSATEALERITLAQKMNLIRLMSILTIIVLAIVALLVRKTRVKNLILDPLEDLNTSLDLFSRGESVPYQMLKPENEVGDAIRKFDQMRDALNESTEKLQEANRRLEEFAYIAAHDLRSPISSIDGYLQIIGESPQLQPEERSNFVQKARAIVSRSLKMLESILSYAKASRSEPKILRISAAQCVKDVLDDLATPIKKSSARISLSQLASIDADQQMLHELFLNIIGNALKYRKPEVTPEISIWQNRRNINGKVYDEICVSDNGIGFDMAHKEEMLKPFRRLASSAGYEGSGLGLAVCVQIMRSHRGVLDFSSKPNEGSTFSVLFPLRDESSLEPKPLNPQINYNNSLS